ncbi:hypothetical protein JW752_05160 [Candidatus Peregrinibacteria bacterium]|nr:hypothetical protein [Candidatus Peregrinibacteria bacterium]
MAIIIIPIIQTSHASNLGPTIHAVPTGGNWTYPGMWEEGVLPGPNDIVEINGDVTLNTDAEIAGLVINSGATLKPRQYSTGSRTHTLTVNGEAVNHGTLKDEYTNTLYYGNLVLIATGNLENTGSLENKNVNVADFKNSGTFSSLSFKMTGNLENTGTVNPNSYIEIAGSQNQTITSSTPLGFLFLKNNTSVNGDLTLNGRLSIDPGFTLSFGNQNHLTANSWVISSGSISGGMMTLGGSDQNFYGEGAYQVSKLILGGSGIKTMKDNKVVNGDVEVLPGVTLQPFKSAEKPTYVLRVNGNMVNRGVIKDDFANNDYYGKLDIEITGSLTNLGTMTNNNAYIVWYQEPGADYYEIRFTDSDFNWLEPAIADIFTVSIIDMVNDDGKLWQIRPVSDGEAGEWHLPHAINASEMLTPELTLLDASGSEITTGITIDFGQINLETPLQKTFTLINTGFRPLAVSGIGLNGNLNFTLESLEEGSLTLAPEESQVFGINFSAFEGETSGSRQAVFSFSSDDSDESSVAITFTGEILMPDPAPVLTEITPVPAITQDKTPDYTFHSTEAGTLNYEGPCQSPVTQIGAGETTLTFSLLNSGYYDYCFLTVTDADGNLSDPLLISPFTVNQVMFENITWDQVIDELVLWQLYNADLFTSEEDRLKELEKALGKYARDIEKEHYPQAAKRAQEAIAAGYPDIQGLVDELKILMADDLDRLKRILIKMPMEVMYGECE